MDDVEIYFGIGDDVFGVIYGYLFGCSFELVYFDLILYNGVFELFGWENVENYEDYFGFMLIGLVFVMVVVVFFLFGKFVGKVLIVNYSCG